MASEDVIELGSSDDEAEPAPKKKKPMPNAMVHIPSKLPGVTIKPSKSNQLRKHKGVSIKPIVFNKSVYNVNSNVIKNKQLGGAFQIPIKNFPKSLKTQLPVPKKCGLNPLNINNLVRPQISVPHKTALNPTGVKGSKLLNNLPPGITIKLVQNASGSEITKQCKITAPPNSVEVLTVELDDEELTETTTATTASPQWYLRPEEPSDKKDQEEQTMGESEVADSMEEQNNKEPESTKFVEITIEDSPLKPLPLKHDNEIGKELSITIEDSPAKVITHVPKNEGSDNENDIKTIPHSKKKLDYPKQSERQVVEIEIDLMSTASLPGEVNEDKDVSPKDITTKEDKTMKHNNGTAYDDCKTNSGEVTDQTKENEDGTNNEFHPVYQNFIDMCFKLENSEDMIKIVEKKIKAYYKQCPKEYVESEDFIDMVSNKIVSMNADPEKMYLYIKDIVDELNLQRKMAKSTIITKKEDLCQDSSKEPEHDESVYHSKKRKQIRKLEKTIKKLHRAIQKLEEQEVDFDDDEDSVYVLTERYKERMVRVHKKFCQLTNAKMPSEPRIHIESRPGRPLGPARKLEKWVNKKVPVGSLLPFPDFHDVLRCVRDSNDEDKLGWSEYDIMEEARDLFTRCGRKLQRRRQENEWRLAASRISQNVDPAEKNADLNKQLNDNRALATSKEVELLNKFAEKQNQLKLEAVEIGDKEAEESPEESDEEEEVEEISNSLEDKQKRKDKLKKLLQETTKKIVEKVDDIKSLKETEGKNAIVDNEEPKKQPNEIDTTENSEPNSEMITECPHTFGECTEDNKDTTEKIDSDQVEPENESDTDKVESEIDELHLYQKSRKTFFPQHNANSSFGSSDSDNPIAISDTLDSDSDVETDKKLSDIISIENSSYSESESTNYNTFPNDTSKNFENLINARLEVEYSKEENVELGENILLASSDEEDTNKVVNEEMGDTCINLKDDNISISETMVYGNTEEPDSVNNDELFSPENNIPSTTPQESPTNSEDNMVIQECYEEDQIGYSKEENVELGENILLASSDEEDTNKVVNEEMGDTCINLKDDNISISETMVYANIEEPDSVNNDELFSPENNIPSTTPQESPTNSEDNMAIQECYEEDQIGSLKDTAIEISKGNEEINSDGSPKEIVDIGSVSDGTSIESMEMQADIDNKVAEQIETLDQLGTQESEVNESSCDSRISEVVEPIS